MSDSVSKYFEKRVEDFKEKYENRKSNKVTYYTEADVAKYKERIKELEDRIKELEIISFQDLGR